MIGKKHTKVTTGVFIPGEFLSQADITRGDIEIAVANKEIRIYPAKSNVVKKVFSFDSPLWECVGFVGREGINGKEHDRYIYDEER